MSESDVIEQIIDKAAMAVEQRLKIQSEIRPQQEKTPVQPEAKQQSYFISISRRFWFSAKYKVTHHIFAEHEWVQNPTGLPPELVSITPKLIMTHEDGSRTIVVNPKARNYRIWR